MGLIFYMSGHPAPQAVKEVPIYFDIKLVHLAEYGLLSLSYSLALFKTTKLSPLKIAMLSIICTYMYGVTDELHQMFIPERSAKFVDTVTNLIGAIVAQGMLLVLLSRLPRSLLRSAELRRAAPSV